MKARNTPRFVLLAGALAACGSAQSRAAYHYAGHDQATMADVNISPGPMPEGESFTGTYHSQEIGEVNLEQTGNTVVGTYEYDRASCHARGHIEGEAEGNLMRFHWTEDQRQCGILSVPPGRGYFLFWKDSVHNSRASGEWGYGDAETGGGRWNLFRLPNHAHSTPASTPSSSGGSSTDGNSSGGGASGGGSTGDPLQGL